MVNNDSTTQDSGKAAAVSATDYMPPSDLQIDRSAFGKSWFRLAPRGTLVVLAFIAGVLGLLMIQFEDVTRLPFWMMVVFFVAMVWLRSAMALACVFIVLVAVKFSTPFTTPYYVDRQLGLIFTSDIIFTFLVMAFAATCFRYLETRKYSLGILSKFGWGGGSKNKRNSAKEFPSLLGGRWWLIPVAIGCSFALLGVFPLDRAAVTKYWIKPEPARLIFLVGAMFLTWFLIRSVVMLAMRWKMDPDQAGVHVRSVIAKEFWREHRAIETRRAKAIKKKSR